jgi:hypothetical protein
MNHELWRVVASGGLALLLSEMQAITNIDTRARLLDKRDFLAWLRVELGAPGSLAFAVSNGVLGLLWDEVQASTYYAPELREQDPPMATGAAVSGGDTLEADSAPAGYTTTVFVFDGLTFAEVGPLATNSQPGAGNYVLALVDDESGEVGLPSLFLTLTA